MHLPWSRCTLLSLRTKRHKESESTYASPTLLREETLLRRAQDELAVGQLRRQTRLSSEAIYEICELTAQYARVEVVRAPGLRAGQHFKFSRAAVALMELVTAPLAPEPAADESLARPLAVQKHTS
jgi:hypothetical protein